jgi:hypothetical protein
MSGQIKTRRKNQNQKLQRKESNPQRNPIQKKKKLILCNEEKFIRNLLKMYWRFYGRPMSTLMIAIESPIGRRKNTGC